MNKKGLFEKTSRIAWTFTLLLLFLLIIVLWRFHYLDISLEDAVGNIIKKSELVSQMKTDLLKSVEAEKNAVLADTDEESKTFADLSSQAAESVEQNRQKLEQLIETGKIKDEMQLLHQFDDCWKEFRKTDKVLLDYAVQNTNLKAAHLSFTKGKEALQHFQGGLTDITEMSWDTPEGSKIAHWALVAISAGFEIYSLQAPHIIESRDERMDEIEAFMAKAEQRANMALQNLRELVKEGSGQAKLMQVTKTFGEFLWINKEVVRLSRENTNVKSVEISLGAKRKITAQCEESLNALQQAIRNREFKATR